MKLFCKENKNKLKYINVHHFEHKIRTKNKEKFNKKKKKQFDKKVQQSKKNKFLQTSEQQFENKSTAIQRRKFHPNHRRRRKANTKREDLHIIHILVY